MMRNLSTSRAHSAKRCSSSLTVCFSDSMRSSRAFTSACLPSSFARSSNTRTSAFARASAACALASWYLLSDF
ncbi:hypothetical protein PISMIDRAFT_277788 [Pisolithus microcarpus 441]|uniref:Uncharacterized protein n=1 Tax=Pisolithus microcarpus 441 TaxID=765257 RepID=A0A0C9YQP1_9AGAM|nr:hypothetical protein PISMIDRAFT_277788 [Pisolithus microcarpus 441]